MIVPNVGRFPALSTKWPRVRGNSEEWFLIWTTVRPIKLCILVIMFDDNITLRRGIIMLPRYNKTIVAHCDLGSMDFVHPRRPLLGKWHPRLLLVCNPPPPFGYTKRHGPHHSVQQLFYNVPWLHRAENNMSFVIKPVNLMIHRCVRNTCRSREQWRTVSYLNNCSSAMLHTLSYLEMTTELQEEK